MLLIERRLARYGLSHTEARSVGGQKFIGAVTEARGKICLTTSVAPPGARTRHRLSPPMTVSQEPANSSKNFPLVPVQRATRCQPARVSGPTGRATSALGAGGSAAEALGRASVRRSKPHRGALCEHPIVVHLISTAKIEHEQKILGSKPKTRLTRSTVLSTASERVAVSAPFQGSMVCPTGFPGLRRLRRRSPGLT